MLLTYGNIGKSQVLKYNFLLDVSNDTYRKKYEEYHKTIENADFAEYLKIEKYLHDSEVNLSVVGADIEIELVFWHDEEKVRKIGKLTFKNASIVSWNKFRRSGHISRLNKPYFPQEYGYDEFYEENGKKFVSIIFFSRKRSVKRKPSTGVYYPMMTVQYQKIEFA